MSRWWQRKKQVALSSTDFSRPCPKTGYYDVFLSFRGEDTRYGFTHNLYHFLRENKVYTFMDVDLTGEDIDYLFKMIEKSRMAVVIYSESFASSDWCLKELEMILQRRKEKKMLMIPIFYKVDIHELKHLTGKTAKCLDELIPKHGNATVQKWKDVVTGFGNISGLCYKDRYEYDFIMEVIVKIKKKLGEYEYTQKEDVLAQENLTLRQEEQVEDSSSSTQSYCADTRNTTTGDEEQVYRVVTSNYFQKALEFMGDLLSVKPSYLCFFVEPEEESSTCLILSNNTDSYVAFLIQCTTEPLKYRVCPSEGLVLPRSTCQVIVTMEAQNTVFPSTYLECSEKFRVQSVITKNDPYNSTEDFYNLFKKDSVNTIDKWWMKVLCSAPPKRISSISDHHTKLPNKGFVHGSMLVTSIDTHPTKSWVLLGLINGSVCIWNYETRAEEKLFKVVDKLGAVYAKFIYEKHWFVGGDSYGLVHVFDYNTSEKVKEFKAHEDDIECVAVHPNSPYVFTASKDKLVKLWNWENDWECNETFEGHSNIVTHVAFNPKDSRSFASASWDGTIKLWSFDSSVAKFTINAHTKFVYSTEYFVGSDDNLYLLSGSHDNSAIWDYESKTLVKTLEGHSHCVMQTLVHPKLPIIITGSLDKTIRIWNKNTHRLELVWKCDLGQIWSMRFIKTSDEVVLGCNDGMIMIKIVNAATPAEIRLENVNCV